MSKQPLIILGAGTMAMEVTDLVEDIGGYEVVGYCISEGKPGILLDRPVMTVEELQKFDKRQVNVIGAIFSVERHFFMRQVENLGYEFVSVIHPSASVSKKATLCKGTVINRLVAIGAYAYIGKHCLINRNCSVGHHTVLGDSCTLGPGVNIAGNCVISSRVLIGMGSNIVQKVSIYNDTFIKAGSLIVK